MVDLFAYEMVGPRFDGKDSGVRVSDDEFDAGGVGKGISAFGQGSVSSGKIDFRGSVGGD